MLVALLRLGLGLGLGLLGLLLLVVVVGLPLPLPTPPRDGLLRFGGVGLGWVVVHLDLGGVVHCDRSRAGGALVVPAGLCRPV